MSSTYAEKLVDVLRRTFLTLFQTELKISDHKTEHSQVAPFEISGIIGITGATKGGVVLSLPTGVARIATARMLGDSDDADLPDEDVYDCVAEIANIVAGNLLPSLKNEDGADYQLSLPSVVVGQHRVVWRRKDTPYDLLLLDSSMGQFAAGINLREPGQDTAEMKKNFNFMVIDDSRVMRRLLQKVIRETDVGDINFIEASDGESALLELERLSYAVDAVFCDICMPKMDGMEFLDALSQKGKLDACPVVVVTGDASDGRKREVVERGAVGFVTKPFTPEVIGGVLKKIIN
ncbi:MAG: response regulator [Planctomycetota bacterium]|jgi:two-component system chemotaxis response regulator CheY